MKGCGVGASTTSSPRTSSPLSARYSRRRCIAPNSFFQPSWLASSQCAPFASCRCASTTRRPPAEPLRLQLGRTECRRSPASNAPRWRAPRRATPARRPGTRRNSRSSGRGRPTAPSTACRHGQSGPRPAAAARRNRRSARCARPAGGGSRHRSAPTAPRRRGRPGSAPDRSGAGLLLAAVEQRQPAIAMPHHPQRRRHALDRAGQRRRRLRLRGLHPELPRRNVAVRLSSTV